MKSKKLHTLSLLSALMTMALVSACSDNSSAPISAASAMGLEPARDPRGDWCDGAKDLQLVNGRIVTMDDKNSTVFSANIKNGKFVAVGDTGDRRPATCTQVLDLGGRTAIPGLIDNHIHIVALGRRPGHDTPFDTAGSISEALQLVRERAMKVPQREFITTIGGWTAEQFLEKRMPTLAELDTAAPNHPVLISNAANLGAVNTAGKAFFQSKGVPVTTGGEIALGNDTLRAVFILKDAMTLDQLKRNTQDTMAWAAGLGLTTVMDMGSNTFTGTAADSIGAFSPYTGYEPLLALARENKQIIRYRLNYISLDTTPELPDLTARLQNAFRRFGSDMLKTVCMAESVWTLRGPGAVGMAVPAAPFKDAVKKVAEAGDCHEQHSLTLVSDMAITSVWEQVNATNPIKDLRWRLAHVPQIDQPTINRVKALGAGLAVHLNPGSGPPYRMIVDSGIRVGAGSDGRNSLPGNPWAVLQYMVTGKKGAAGDVINRGQTLTRLEALRLYTASNGWFSFEENALGSVEVGKLADIVVLNKNYLDAGEVPDDAINRLSSQLTIVDGKVVHDTGSVSRLK